MKDIKLSVIIPAFNEAHRIGKTLEAINNYLSKQNYSYEIVVVDDGSRDETVNIVKKLAAKVKNLQVISNSVNRGKGATVKQGMLASSGNFRLFTDADNSVSIDQIEKFWPYFDQGFDVVIGSIELPGAQISEKAGWHRRFFGKLIKMIIRFLISPVRDIHDTQRGFKMFSAQAAQAIFPKLTISRWLFDVEVLTLGKKLNFKIKEVPVIWNNLGDSKIKISHIFNILKELWQIFINLNKGVYG